MYISVVLSSEAKRLLVQVSTKTKVIKRLQFASLTWIIHWNCLSNVRTTGARSQIKPWYRRFHQREIPVATTTIFHNFFITQKANCCNDLSLQQAVATCCPACSDLYTLSQWKELLLLLLLSLIEFSWYFFSVIRIRSSSTWCQWEFKVGARWLCRSSRKFNFL